MNKNNTVAKVWGHSQRRKGTGLEDILFLATLKIIWKSIGMLWLGEYQPFGTPESLMTTADLDARNEQIAGISSIKQ